MAKAWTPSFSEYLAQQKTFGLRPTGATYLTEDAGVLTRRLRGRAAGGVERGAKDLSKDAGVRKEWTAGRADRPLDNGPVLAPTVPAVSAWINFDA